MTKAFPGGAGAWYTGIELFGGNEIPIAAQVFSIVDVYNALTSDRPYRAAWPHEMALSYIRRDPEDASTRSS